MTTLIEAIPTLRAGDSPLSVSAALDPQVFRAIRRRMVLEGCKWDAQVGDTTTLADFALLLAPGTWPELAAMAEQLATETLAAEAELMRRPDLHPRIGVPRSIRKLLRRYSADALLAGRGGTVSAGEERAGVDRAVPATMEHGRLLRLGADALTVPPRREARVMRFDFHWTTEGWRISEVNADVPGGFTEASNFTAMMAQQVPEHVPTGDPAQRWTRCIARTLRNAPPGGRIGLIWAAGFIEDYQIVSYLARRLEVEHGCTAHLLGPQQVRWRDGRPHAVSPAGEELPLDVIVRFYQAEWLAHLPRRIGWHHFFAGSRVPLLNPGSAILSESKRLPLVWDELSCDMSMWRRLLPETRDPGPRNAPWRRSDDWLLKTAYSNNGDTVTHRSTVPARQWRRAALDVMFSRGTWLAQRRFQTVAVATPRGPMYPCLGVYVIDGEAAGIYGRISAKPVIDYQAIDVAVLAPREEGRASADDQEWHGQRVRPGAEKSTVLTLTPTARSTSARSSPALTVPPRNGASPGRKEDVA